MEERQTDESGNDTGNSVESIDWYGPHGNTEHYHLYCQWDPIKAMRDTFDMAMDDAGEENVTCMARSISRTWAAERVTTLCQGLRKQEMDSARDMIVDRQKKEDRQPPHTGQRMLRTEQRSNRCGKKCATKNGTGLRITD